NCACQSVQVEKKDAEEVESGKDKDNDQEKGDEVPLENKEKKGEKEPDPDVGSKGEKEEKMTEEEVKAPKARRRPKTMQIKVTLLDDTLYECELDVRAFSISLHQNINKVSQSREIPAGQELTIMLYYYGLAIWETPTKKIWMDLTKAIRRQIHGANYNFTFNVKFYPPDPAQLSEDITRYFLCLQLRKDILQGCLPCSFVTLALLGSYALQSEVGEYDPEVHGTEYAKDMKMAQGQTKELEDKMMELHHTYKSMTPAQADLMFLENAKKLSMYGVDIHQAKDLDGVDIMLGVCSSGLMVYKDKLRINRFPWPKVLKVSYKRSSFFIKIRPSELEQYESAIGFKLPNYKAAKKLWKVCVEHHTFFRLTSTEMATTPRKFLALGSKFRYSGRTQAQTRQASSLIDRPAPLFQRSSSKRNSCSLDGGTLSYILYNLIGSQSAKRTKKLDGETIYIRHSNLMLEDVDKTQTEIMRHHTSISELKRSFMESVPEPQPSEWDKRLLTNSPFRTASINGQVSSIKGSMVQRFLMRLESETLYSVLHQQSPVVKTFGSCFPGSVTYKDMPLVHTETKTITYESAQPVDNLTERESGVLLSAQTITSETISTTTTTQITKTVKGGISETRIEKRIVITGDTEIDHDKALAQAIKEAKEQHPDMSVTKVVVHQETEIAPE
uniref:Protein 4.1 n=1 Tax=Echeneis naucrates TaxID=173247 RepID=A0A665VTP1_ECHNA